MKRIFTTLFFCCLTVAFVDAQTDVVSAGFNAGSVTENGISAVLGQPFDAIVEGGGYEVSEGVTQAQLVTEDITAEVDYGEAYTENGFNYPAGTGVGIYHDRLYEPNGTQEHYDLIKNLTLKVLKVLICPSTVEDGDNNSYDVVAVANYCWTQSNLRATHYADAGHTEIARAEVYSAPGHDDVAANEETYGRLYTWYSAVGLPEDGSGTLTPDAHGYVQGACPEGWHIPTATEMAALEALSTEDIRTSELWRSPNNNTNSTGFTSLPAGLYSAAHSRFEQMLVNTGYWSLSNGTSVPVTATEFPYYCDRPVESPVSTSDMLSVRCVKNDE